MSASVKEASASEDRRPLFGSVCELSSASGGKAIIPLVFLTACVR